MPDSLILAVDIGTSSVRALGFDAGGTVRFGARRLLHTRHPRPGWSEQDPDAIVTATIEALTEALASAPQRSPVAALVFSAQMYSVLAIDGDGTALTPSLAWTDTRSIEEATTVRKADPAGDLVAQTGCPIQPIYPLAKIRWMRTNLDLPAQVRFVSVKDYVIERFTGRLVSDWSTASATGLLDVSTRHWSQAALQAAGVAVENLPTLASPTAIIERRSAALHELGLGADAVVMLGAGDAPLSSIGSGAVNPDVLAINIGTSAAARRFLSRPDTDRSGRLWTYVATDEDWVTGGIIGSAGSVYHWLVDLTLGATDGDAYRRATEMAATVQPGADGLVFLPYFTGEQSPRWQLGARGMIAGLDLHHGKPHLLRAALEGIAVALQRVRLTIDEVTSPPVREVAVTGGVTASPFVQQLLADVLGLPIVTPAGHEGSARGAAILAAAALGIVPDIRAVDGPGWSNAGRIHPCAEAHDRYRAVYEDHVSIATTQQDTT